jgi:hypothetical protein
MRVLRDAGFVLLLFVLPAFSQSTDTSQQATPEQPKTAETPSQNSSAPVVHRHHDRVPCWRVAKISPDLVNQRWKIEDQGRVEIAAVCRDTKTTAKQKQEKIHAVHQEKDEEIANIIPADQLKAFNACEAEREKARPKTSSKEKELGPCGGIIPQNADSGMGDMQH